MSALIIVEHDNHQFNPGMRQVLGAALALDEKPVMLVVGHQCEAVAESIASVKGVAEVWLVDNPQCAHLLAEPLARLVSELAESFDYILAPASTFGKNCLPRVAAQLDVGQLSDVTAVIDKSTFDHPVYAGNAIERVRLLDAKKLMTIRATAFEAVMDSQTACGIERLDKVVAEGRSRFISHSLSKSERPELGSARRVVSGGRGLQSGEKFKLIEELADVLGAAVGASRAAVDAGFVPNDYQVGQTGKVVAPELYIAVGISGAIQHLAGMKDSKVIVAINKDEDAPIFQVADYGLVGDLFTLVPELIERLKQ